MMKRVRLEMSVADQVGSKASHDCVVLDDAYLMTFPYCEGRDSSGSSHLEGGNGDIEIGEVQKERKGKGEG